MPRYVAMIRGVNVGGTKLPMAPLRRAMESAGYGEVRTYLQSGNAVFNATRHVADLGGAIEGLIRSTFSLEVPVVIRSGSELRDVAAVNPLLVCSDDPTKLHVTFLATPPDSSVINGLGLPETGEELAVSGREVYLYCPQGYGRAKLTNSFLERRLGITATTRNWRTVLALTQMATGSAPSGP